MKLVCDRLSLAFAFKVASGAVPSRSPKPVLVNVKLEAGKAVTMTATDLEIGVNVDVASVEIQSPGSVLLPVERFGAILRETQDEKLTIQTDQKAVMVTGARSSFRIPVQDVQDFPSVANLPGSKCHQIPAEALRSLIRRTVFATDPSSSRYSLGGVLVDLRPNEVGFIATDGRRLSHAWAKAKKVDGHEAENAIVPARALQFIDKVIADDDGSVDLAIVGNDAFVRSKSATVYSRLVEGRFPKWRDVFPKRDNASKVVLQAGMFHASVKQAAIFCSEESRGVDFTFKPGLAVMGARTADIGTSNVELPVAFGGEDSITLDPKYLTDYLRAIGPGAEFTLEFKGADGAAVLTMDGYQYIQMPLARDR